MSQRILVAEDEMVIAFDLCDTVEEAGYEVEGPHVRTSSALLACENSKPDLAILDITFGEDDSYLLASMLAAEDVPIIFHCDSQLSAELSAQFPNALAVQKPCPPAALLAAVSGVLEDSASLKD